MHIEGLLGNKFLSVIGALITDMEQIDLPHHWDPWQLAAIEAASNRAAVLVVGLPGTGKTSCLVEAVAACSPRGNLFRTAVLAANRTLAQSLRVRLVRRVGASQVNARVTTIHGLARSIVASAEPELRILTGPEQDHHIRDLLVGSGSDIWPDELAQAIETPQFVREVRAVLARARQLGLDPQDLVIDSSTSEWRRWQALAEFAEQYLSVSDAMGVVDYAELIHRARLALLDDAVAETWVGQLDRVVIDDFQELDPAQVALLVDLRRLGVSVTAWADPLTRTSDFRGVDVRSITEFVDRFSVPGAQPERLELPLVHRCGPGLVSALREVGARLPQDGGVSHVDVRSANELSHMRPEISAALFPTTAASHMSVADTLWQWRDDDVAWHDMAVITRSGGDAVEGLARVLRSSGVPVSVEGDQRALADNPAVQTLLGALRAVGHLAAGGAPSNALAQDLLQSPLVGLDALELRMLSRAVPDGLGVALGQPDQFRNVSAAGSAASGDFAELVCDVARDVSRGESTETALWRVWDGTDWPSRLRQQALDGGSGGELANRDLDAVIALFDWAARRQGLAGVEGLQVLIDDVMSQDIAADTAREAGVTPNSVVVTTAHRTRGREWRRVAVVDVNEGLWPNLRRRGVIFDPDRLTRDGVSVSPTSPQLLHQERRLFLLALSRATEHVVVHAVQDEDSAVQPSRFVAELGLEITPMPHQTATAWSPAQLVGELRRCLLDESASPALRQCAANELARLGDVCRAASPDRWWGTRDQTGLVDIGRGDRTVHLSPSQIEQLLRCPRQWFLRHQVGADTTESTALSIGIIVHDAAEQLTVLRRAGQLDSAACEQVARQAEAAVSELAFTAPWQRDEEVMAVRNMVSAFARWEAERRADEVVVEAPFSLELDLDGPVVVSGRIDRIERLGDTVHIVDLKTGKTAVSVRAASEHIQLAVYQYAALRGALDAAFPDGAIQRVSGADLVFVRDTSKGMPKVRSQSALRPDSPLVGERPLHEWLIEQIARAAGIKRDGEFYASPSADACRGCPFLVGCPAQQGVEAWQ